MDKTINRLTDKIICGPINKVNNHYEEPHFAALQRFCKLCLQDLQFSCAKAALQGKAKTEDGSTTRDKDEDISVLMFGSLLLN